MKIVKLFAASLIAVFFATACQNKPGSVSEGDLKNETDSLSYALGVNIGNSFRTQQIEVNAALVASGIQAGIDSTALFDAEKTREILMALNQRMNQRDMEKREKENAAKSGQNKLNGDNFRAEYQKQEGVKTLEGGILYKVIKSGSGKSPKATDVVSVNYVGKLTDGQEFDSSMKSGKPAQFPVNGVIMGWQKAIQAMKEGDKWEVVIPPDMGYGSQGAGELIGPDATLVFEIELLKVENTK